MVVGPGRLAGPGGPSHEPEAVDAGGEGVLVFAEGKQEAVRGEASEQFSDFPKFHPIEQAQGRHDVGWRQRVGPCVALFDPGPLAEAGEPFSGPFASPFGEIDPHVAAIGSGKEPLAQDAAATAKVQDRFPLGRGGEQLGGQIEPRPDAAAKVMKEPGEGPAVGGAVGAFLPGKNPLVPIGSERFRRRGSRFRGGGGRARRRVEWNRAFQ